MDPLIELWSNGAPRDMPVYEAGSWGPREADDLITRELPGARWL
jgi:glucose-6-phosphate 1-dehydrogenase